MFGGIWHGLRGRRWIPGRASGAATAVDHAAVVAALLGVGALAAIVLERSAGSIWSQLLVLFVMTPAALGGGYLRVR